MSSTKPRSRSADPPGPAGERAILADGASALGFPLTDLQLDRLATYLAVLRSWAPRTNLISHRDLDSVAARHVVDSLAPARALAEIGSALEIADLGSGAGLPGIPLAIALEPRRMVLVEPRQRRSSFLRAVARELPALALDVRCVRAEELGDAGPFDAIVSRASLPLERLLQAATRLLRDGGHLLIHHGPTQHEEGLATASGLMSLPSISYRLPGFPAELRIGRWQRTAP
jgi:16S rRNA (guanine527-N7)-methyltransferase